MSRLVMLPNARRVPEFPPVSPGGHPGVCLPAYRACEKRARLRSKAPEADYLAAVRGIITGPWLVAPNSTVVMDPAIGWANVPAGYRAARSVPAAGGRDCEDRRPRQVRAGGLAYALDGLTWRRSAQVDRGAKDVAAIELSS
jgi:hypothetical protein